jgi:hypothetical protein
MTEVRGFGWEQVLERGALYLDVPVSQKTLWLLPELRSALSIPETT